MKKLIWLTCLMICYVSFSQENIVKNAELHISPIYQIEIPEDLSDSIVNPLELLTNSDSVYISIAIDLVDLINIEYLIITLIGDDEYDLMNHSYYIDAVEEENLGDDYVRLELGEYLYFTKYNLSITIGEESYYKEFNFNNSN